MNLIIYRVVNGNDITKLVVFIPRGSNAQRVMEEAANKNIKLRFQATYFNRELGYFVDKIGDTASANGNYWFLYVNDGPGHALRFSPLGVSNWITNHGSTVEWRYESRMH